MLEQISFVPTSVMLLKYKSMSNYLGFIVSTASAKCLAPYAFKLFAYKLSPNVYNFESLR